MPDPAKQTPRQRAHRFYMMEAMRRLEWDLHHAIDSSGRIPETWHEIATAPPHPKRERVTLRLNPEVLKFFRSMGSDYGPRINAVLESFMHARLAGVLRGAETAETYRPAGARPDWGEMEEQDMPRSPRPSPGERIAALRRAMAARQATLPDALP
ncbi:BrnA antitoxin of type II toxin-antitoxin system [Gemmobacter aquatilis]|uniref:BrnA antitoxin of type II toxin-antitoxin system n=1 Tax=Gemmobacter aquatilis TaxID=933059 RepID=A0A1H8ED56_9RHOB|nr:BrnA antitoxin family protein [Gemmobacter aquatilis]SEN17435.1 BrnA antitoxin of type II toxin-antitoxin system [Gemmobacter aquatilis]